MAAVATPEDGARCPGLVTIAGVTLAFLEAAAA